MGSTTRTCVASGLPITGGPVRWLLLNRSPYRGIPTVTDPVSEWAPRCLPIRAVYDGYSGIYGDADRAICPDPLPPEEQPIRDVIVRALALDRPDAGVLSPRVRLPDLGTFGGVAGAVRDGTCWAASDSIEGDPAVPVMAAMIREDVWQGMLGMTLLPEYPGDFARTVGDYRAEVRHAAGMLCDRLARGLDREPTDADPDRRAGRRWRRAGWESIYGLRDAPMLGRLCGYTRTPPGIGLIDHLALLYADGRLDDAMADRVADLWFMEDMLWAVRRHWMPSHGCGSDRLAQHRLHLDMIRGIVAAGGGAWIPLTSPDSTPSPPASPLPRSPRPGPDRATHGRR